MVSMALIAVAATARSAGRRRDDPQRPRRAHRNSGILAVIHHVDGRRALASWIEITVFDIVALSKVADFNPWRRIRRPALAGT
jgi:hypothetical protein